MRKLAGSLCLAVLVALVSGVVSASATGNEKLVEGLVYDGWCSKSDAGECPSEPFPQCLHEFGCNLYRPLAIEGTIVNLRRRGTSIVVARVTPTEGRFQVELSPGRYLLRAILPEGKCLLGQTERLTVKANLPGPIYIPVGVYSAGSWDAGTGTCVPFPHP